MTSGLFTSLQSAFRQQSSLDTLTQERTSDSTGVNQGLTLSTKSRQSFQDNNLSERSNNRQFRLRSIALQILVSQYGRDAHKQEIILSVLLQTLALSRTGKFPNFDMAFSHIKSSLTPEASRVLEAFSQSAEGRSALNFIHQSEQSFNSHSLEILIQTAQHLIPPPAYLGRTLALGVFLTEIFHGNREHTSLLKSELSRLGRDFLYATQTALSEAGNGFEYIVTHSLSESFGDGRLWGS